MLSATVVMGLLAAFSWARQEDDSSAQWKKILQDLKEKKAVLKREPEDHDARQNKLQAERLLEDLGKRAPSQAQDGEQDKKAILKLVEERLRREEERIRAEHLALLAELSRLLDQRPSKGAPAESEKQSLDEMERRLLEDLNALRRLKERGMAKPKVGLVGITPEAVESGGVRIGGLLADGPAEKAGLQKGDVIVSVGGKRIQTTADLIEQMRVLGPGAKVEVEYMRGEAALRAIVILGEKKEE